MTVEATLRWPHLTTEGCSKVQAIVTFSLNTEFSQKIPKYDDASQEKCRFSLCVLPSSLLRNYFLTFVIPSRKAASTVEGHSNESFLNFHYHLFGRVFHNKIIFLRISEKLLMYPTSWGLTKTWKGTERPSLPPSFHRWRNHGPDRPKNLPNILRIRMAKLEPKQDNLLYSLP